MQNPLLSVSQMSSCRQTFLEVGRPYVFGWAIWGRIMLLALWLCELDVARVRSEFHLGSLWSPESNMGVLRSAGQLEIRRRDIHLESEIFFNIRVFLHVVISGVVLYHAFVSTELVTV